jgi:hypothetical protein
MRCDRTVSRRENSSTHTPHSAQYGLRWPRAHAAALRLLPPEISRGPEYDLLTSKAAQLGPGQATLKLRFKNRAALGRPTKQKLNFRASDVGSKSSMNIVVWTPPESDTKISVFRPQMLLERVTEHMHDEGTARIA